MGVSPARKVAPIARRARHARHAPWSGAVAHLDARVADLERRIAEFDRRFYALTVKTRMQLALLVSIAIHIVVVAGVSFTMPDKNLLSNLQQPLEVVLVNAKSTTKPAEPDALTQANLYGGGNTDARRRAKSPLPVTREDKQAVDSKLATRRSEERRVGKECRL